MAGGGKQQQEGGSNTEAAAFVFCVLVFLVLFVLWKFARPVILYPAFAMDTVSIHIIEAIKGLGPTGKEAKSFVTSIFDGRTDPWDGVTIAKFMEVRKLVGMQTRFVITALIAAMAALVLFKMKGHGYARTFSLGGGKGKPQGLAFYQTERWKTATASANFDPDGRNKEIKPAATPLEWLRDHGVEFENSMLDRDAAEKAFAEQLGKPWHSLKRADLVHQTVAVLIGLHYIRHKQALEEREAINIAWAAGHDGTKAMQDLVERYVGAGDKPKDAKLASAIASVMDKHAYVQTGLYSLLDKARARAGVLASSDMVWLRWVDRTLHYTLNNVGRRRFHTEAAGVVCHFFAEHVSSQPLPEPHVEQAIDGIEDYLAEQGVMSLKQFFAQGGDL